MIKANEPAFSKSAFYHRDCGYDGPNNGLTIREHFASMAMQGMLSNKGIIDTTNWECIAEHSVKQADLLILELNKQ